jgi:putative ABC transport system permease protein
MESSRLDRALIGEVGAAADAKTGSNRVPLVSPELVVSDYVFYPRLGQSVSTLMRGVLPVGLAVHDGAHILSGSWPDAGRVLIGRKLAAHLGGADVGDPIRVGSNTWIVSGILAADGSTLETEMWFDLNELGTAARRDGISAIVFKVRNPARVNAVVAALDADPRFGARFVHEPEYFNQQSSDTQQIWALTAVVSILLGVAAVFGGMNTMHASVAQRVREIGVLRAVGFTGRQVLAGFVLECVSVAAVGSLVAAVIVLGLTQISIQLFSASGSLIDASFRLTSGILAGGLGLGLVLGLLGGLLPAWHASRVRVVDAIRDQ